MDRWNCHMVAALTIDRGHRKWAGLHLSPFQSQRSPGNPILAIQPLRAFLSRFSESVEMLYLHVDTLRTLPVLVNVMRYCQHLVNKMRSYLSHAYQWDICPGFPCCKHLPTI